VSRQRILRPALALAALALAANVAADPLDRAAVERALAGYEAEPTVADVRAWGPDGARSLLAIARDVSLQGVVRVRALHALRALAPDAGVHRLLRETAALPTAELLVRRACFDALLEGFDDVAEVARHLRDPLPEVRDGAAWTLLRSPRADARAALRARLAVETDATVRTTLAQLDAPPSPPSAATVVPVTPTPAARPARRH
jgi:hypothetical protein